MYKDFTASETDSNSRARRLPPSNNMGGKSSTGTGAHMAIPSSIAFVDQVSFTARTSDVPGIVPSHTFTDQDFALLLSPFLEEIFGFGVTSDRGRGLNFYDSSFVLGDSWGFICVGGERQRGSFLVQLTGQGAMAAKPGWEKRLYDYLHTIPSAKITRVDLAHDDYTGQVYNPTKARDDYVAEKFTSNGRRPSCRQDGNWIFPDGSGLTFYVGKRENGKILRVYEKGKQLANRAATKFREWTRTEVELHNVDRQIPFDVLINPGPYLAGSYPALAFISDQSNRIATKKNTLSINMERAISMVRNQVGQYINALVQVFGSADAAFEKITRPGTPTRLIIPDWSQSPPSWRLTPQEIAENLADDFTHALAFSY